MEKVSAGEKSSGASNQKLDDFEQLLDSASASSNIINKKLVCRNNSDISDDIFMSKATESSSLSHSELLTKNLSVGLLNSFNCEASSSGVSSTNGSASNPMNNISIGSNAIEETPSSNDVIKLTEEDDDNDELLESESTKCPSSNPEDFYLNFVDEIKNDWLHFRPKTPPPPLLSPHTICFSIPIL